MLVQSSNISFIHSSHVMVTGHMTSTDHVTVLLNHVILPVSATNLLLFQLCFVRRQTL